MVAFNKIFIFATSVAVILGLVAFTQDNQLKAVNGETTSYDITLDSSNSPTLTGGSGTQVTRYVNFSYTDAAITSGHVYLNALGIIANEDQITTITSIQVYCEGEVFLKFGASKGVWSYPFNLYLENGASITFKSYEVNYFQISRDTGGVVNSIILTYTCAPFAA